MLDVVSDHILLYLKVFPMDIDPHTEHQQSLFRHPALHARHIKAHLYFVYPPMMYQSNCLHSRQRQPVRNACGHCAALYLLSASDSRILLMACYLDPRQLFFRLQQPHFGIWLLLPKSVLRKEAFPADWNPHPMRSGDLPDLSLPTCDTLLRVAHQS